MIEYYDDDGTQIVLTDQGPFGFPDGTWIACAMRDGWKVFYSQGDLLVNGFEGQPEATTKEEALEATRHLIRREKQELRDAIAQYEARVQQEESQSAAGVVAPINPYEINKVEVPIQLIVDLHNALAREDSLRGKTQSVFRSMAEKNNKAHLIRGLFIMQDGQLVFNEAAYTEAVYRGKQETRLRALADEFESLQNTINMAVKFREDEMNAAVAIGVQPGARLAELPALSGAVATFQKNIEQMRRIASFVLTEGEATVSNALVNPGVRKLHSGLWPR